MSEVANPVYPSSRPIITHEELAAYVAALPLEPPKRNE